MQSYTIALLVDMPAETYEDAKQQAEWLADGIAQTEQISCSAVLSYEEDFEGQRVLYLDPVEEE